MPAPRDAGWFVREGFRCEETGANRRHRHRRRPSGFCWTALRGLLSDSWRNLGSVDSAYYANSAYANAVDVSTSYPEHSGRG